MKFIDITLLAIDKGRVAVNEDCRLDSDDVRAYGDNSVVTPAPDKAPLTIILFAEIFVVVSILAW